MGAPIPIAGPFEVTNPSTQAFGQPLPSNYEVVFRPGYVRGGKGTSAGNIYGTWAEVVQTANSMAIIAAGTAGGATIWIKFDGNDPGNPEPSYAYVPTGSYSLPAGTCFVIDALTSGIVFEAGASFAANFLPVAIRGGTNMPGVSAFAGGVFTLSSDAEFGIALDSVEFDVEIDCTAGATVVMQMSASLLVGTFDSSDNSGTFACTATGGSVVDVDAVSSAFASITFEADASSTVDTSYAADTTLTDDATRVNYAPSTPGDWASPPTDVGGALDDLAATVAGAANAPIQFVYRPGYSGAVNPGQVYNSWSALLAAVNAADPFAEGGPVVRIVFDGEDPSNPSPGVCKIPIGVHYVLPAIVEWVMTAGTTHITIATGASFQSNWVPSSVTSLGLTSGILSFIGGSPAPFAITGTSPTMSAENVDLGDSTNTLFNVTAAGVLQLAPLVLSRITASAVTSGDSTGFCDVYATDSTDVALGAFGAMSLANVTIEIDASSLNNEVGVTSSLIDDAFEVGYVPTTPGDWTVPPADVGDALDELAAEMGGGAVVPLPPGPAGLVLTTTGGTLPTDVAWEPQGGFAITAFSVTAFSGFREIGNPIVNPTIAATYNELPTSASVATTNPVTSTPLTTPFTSGTITGTFDTNNTVNGSTATATLTATNVTTTTRSVTATFAAVNAAASTTNLTPGQTLWDALYASSTPAPQLTSGRAGAWTFASGALDHQVFGFLTSKGLPTFKDAVSGISYTPTILGSASITYTPATGTPSSQNVTFYDVAAPGFNGGIVTS